MESGETSLKRGLLYTMLLIRRFEEKVLEVLAYGKLASTMCHVSIGQEAVAAGVCAAMAPGDYVSSTHRGHGHLIARGGDIKRMMAELFGKATGYCKGRGGSMHLTDAALSHLGANGVVGGHIGIGTGAGLSALLRGSGQVSVCFFGDGAATEGIFHEALNMAVVWRLPVVYVCENNMYAMSLPWYRATAELSFARRALGYGLPGIDVDGMDPMAVYHAAAYAVGRARAGQGPTLIGAQTYRFLGHSRGDPSTYRPKDEEEHWRRRDPVLTFPQRLLGEGVITESDLAAMEQRIMGILDEAIRFAEESPPAPAASVFEDVYA